LNIGLRFAEGVALLVAGRRLRAALYAALRLTKTNARDAAIPTTLTYNGNIYALGQCAHA
jgi:hypothetical protein